MCHWLGTPAGTTVLAEALTHVLRKVGDRGGRPRAELEREEGNGHYQGNTGKPWQRLFADVTTASQHKQADGWKAPLRAASCSTMRGPSL